MGCQGIGNDLLYWRRLRKSLFTHSP